MIFEIYNVSFKQKKDFFFALGYSGVIADSQIKKQYGSIQALVKKRLGTNIDSEIQTRLSKLKDDYYTTLEMNNKTSIKMIKVKRPVFDLYKSAYDSLANNEKELLQKAVASIHNIDVSELQQYL